MPSWPNSNVTSDDDDEYMSEFSSMQMEYFQTPDTVIDPSFCGLVTESDRRCILHRQRAGKFVAFEGTDTGRRFIGCATEAINELKEKKKQLEEQAKIELQMEKLKLKKEQRCILQSQADIIQNTRKAMKELEVEKDLLKEEKKKLENVIAELLKVGHGCKEKLDKIKEVVMEE
ncbi:hypothetical protein VPH35_040708 [Triticum aestivum]